MYGIIIYNRENAVANKNYISWYIDKFKKRGIKLDLVFSDDIDYDNLPDFAIVRVIAPDITQKLESLGVICFNNYKTSYITNDKELCYKYVNENGIDILDLYSINEIDRYPVVIKPKNSHGGDRVNIAYNFAELKALMPLYEGDNYVIQAAVNNLGKDLRVYVIGKKIMASMLRVSKTDFRSNFCLGGKAEVYNLSKNEIQQINKIIDLFDFDFVGIDFIFNDNKIIFNEIEDVVGSRMIYTYTDIDIVDLYVAHIISKLS